MKTGEIEKLDKLWSEIVLKDARCLICGESVCDPHHFKTKKQGFMLRWWIPNGIPLCRLHHNGHRYSAHLGPKWFESQVKGIKGREYIKDIEQRANLVFKGTFEDVHNYLIGKTETYD